MIKRHKFNTRNQQVGETIDQYVTDLKTKAQTCEFAILKDSLKLIVIALSVELFLTELKLDC